MIKQFSQRVLVREELIQLVIPANTGQPQTKLQLPDSQNLRNTHLLGLEVYHFADIPINIISGLTVVSLALMRSMFLTLQAYNGKNFVWQDPIVNYHTQSPVTELNPSTFAGQKVNYPKSYIEIADPTLIDTENAQSLPIRIFYRESKMIERKDGKSSFLNQS